MNRRDFVVSASASLLAVAHARPERYNNPAKLDRMSIMTYNFGNVLKVPGGTGKATQTLDVLDLPQMFVDRYGIHNIEFQSSHLPVSDPTLMGDLLARIKTAKSRISQINLEGGGVSISSPDAAQREAAITLCSQWIDHAASFGCPRVMINQGRLTPEVQEESIAALKRIGDYGKSKKVVVSMEDRARAAKIRNLERGQVVYPPAVLPAPPAWVVDEATKEAWKHGYPFVLPADYVPTPLPTWVAPGGENLLLAELIKATGTHINIDTGGMGVETQEDMNARLRELMPFTSGQIHINWRDNPGWDLPATIRYTHELGFKGMYVIEARPTGDSYTVTDGLREVIYASM